jgi:hypothetical protein
MDEMPRESPSVPSTSRDEEDKVIVGIALFPVGAVSRSLSFRLAPISSRTLHLLHTRLRTFTIITTHGEERKEISTTHN